MLLNSSLKLPLPKPPQPPACSTVSFPSGCLTLYSHPIRWMISKNSVGLSPTGFVKTCSKIPCRHTSHWYLSEHGNQLIPSVMQLGTALLFHFRNGRDFWLSYRSLSQETLLDLESGQQHCSVWWKAVICLKPNACVCKLQRMHVPAVRMLWAKRVCSPCWACMS